MNKLLAALVTIVTMVSAHATTITFEDAAGDVINSSGAVANDQSVVYGSAYNTYYGNYYGTAWQEAGAKVTLVNEWDHAHTNSNFYGISNSFYVHGGYGIRVDLGGVLFDLTSLDNYAYGSDWTVTGSNGATASLAAGTYTGTTTSFGSVFSNLSWFTITGGYSELDIDNIVINGSAVPEPTSLALVGLSLAGLGYARRKQLKKA